MTMMMKLSIQLSPPLGDSMGRVSPHLLIFSSSTSILTSRYTLHTLFFCLWRDLYNSKQVSTESEVSLMSSLWFAVCLKVRLMEKIIISSTRMEKLGNTTVFWDWLFKTGFSSCVMYYPNPIMAFVMFMHSFAALWFNLLVQLSRLNLSRFVLSRTICTAFFEWESCSVYNNTPHYLMVCLSAVFF